MENRHLKKWRKDHMAICSSLQILEGNTMVPRDHFVGYDLRVLRAGAGLNNIKKDGENVSRSFGDLLNPFNGTFLQDYGNYFSNSINFLDDISKFPYMDGRLDDTKVIQGYELREKRAGNK